MDSFNGLIESNKGSNSSRFAVWVLSIVAILLPIFFIPSSVVSLPVAKMLLLSVGVLVALAAVILTTIQHGEVRIPWNLMTASVLAIPLAFLVASVFSSNPSHSLWGYGFENGTFGFIILGALATLLVASLMRNGQKYGTILWGLLSVSIILGLFHVIRFFVGASKLSFGLFTDVLANTVGGWNELAIWFGLTAVLSVIMLETMKPIGTAKIVSYASLVLSVIVMAVINFKTAWILSGVFAVVFLVYELSRVNANQDGSSKRKVSWFALGLLIVSLFCVLAGSTIATGITQKLDVGSVEVRPSWGATFMVLKSALSDNVLIGAGPNNFTDVWLKHKPDGINETIFWNTDFTTGIGLVPTFAITTGILGILAWAFFFVMIIRYSVKLMFREGVDAQEKLMSVSSVFGTLFLWSVAVFYTPSSALLALAFFFTGLFVASLYRAGYLKVKGFSLFSVPRASFVSVLLLIVVLIGVVSFGFLFIERAVAQIYFGKAVLVANERGNMDMAESYLNKAVSVHPFDSFYRSLSTVSITKLSNLLNDQNATAESVQAGFGPLLSSAIQNAQTATQVNPSNYQNWTSLAQVYASVVPQPFKIADAYESAKTAFEKARELNPSSPAIVLSMARLESDHENLSKAAEVAEEAVKLKTNYADGHFFLSQIAVQQGNLYTAIEKTQTTILLSPQNAGLYFQLGILYFNLPDYTKASQALAQAVQIIPDYANARYFLGLSLARTGDKAGATAQFEAIQKTNPDNAEIKSVLANLKAGKDPLSGLGKDAQPTNRQTLPVSGQ